MSDTEFKRTIFLNRLLSSSPTQAKEKDATPTHGAYDLFKVLDQRRKRDVAIEFFGADDNKDDAIRLAKGAGKSYIKLTDIQIREDAVCRYIICLIEYVNADERSMPVVDMKTFSGRELTGTDDERGAYTCHFIVKTPLDGAYDDANYRCALEVNYISRRSIEHLLCRQLRRVAIDEEWAFPVWKTTKKGQVQESKKYHAKLELASDVGRSFDMATGHGAELSQIVFTKRHEKQNTGTQTDMIQTEFFANVSVRVSAKQGPTDPQEKVSWFRDLRQWYVQKGYEARTYFRHAKGGLVSGEMTDAIASATDLVMCPKEYIVLSTEPKRWCKTIDNEIVSKMQSLLNNDGLWEHAQQS
ncbi:MAG: hypothetical protein ABSA13_12900 [Beijerinckiaceae bacterium]|jgi:hypothetical protein